MKPEPGMMSLHTLRWNKTSKRFSSEDKSLNLKGWKQQ